MALAPTAGTLTSAVLPLAFLLHTSIAPRPPVDSHHLHSSFWAVEMAFLVVIAISIVAGLLAREFYSWYRLSHVPGPFWHGITGFSMARAALNGSVHEYYMELHEKYGESSPAVLLLEREKLMGGKVPWSVLGRIPSCSATATP